MKIKVKSFNFNDLQKYREATWRRRRFEDKVDAGVYRRYEFDPGDRAYADSLALQPHFTRMKNLLTMNTERGRASKYLMHRHQWNKYTHKDRPAVGHMMQPGASIRRTMATKIFIPT
eukprot:UN01762